MSFKQSMPLARVSTEQACAFHVTSILNASFIATNQQMVVQKGTDSMVMRADCLMGYCQTQSHEITKWHCTADKFIIMCCVISVGGRVKGGQLCLNFR